MPPVQSGWLKKQGSFTSLSSKIDFPGIWLSEKYEVFARVIELSRLRELA
jgi:hypothetical protein